MNFGQQPLCSMSLSAQNILSSRQFKLNIAKLIDLKSISIDKQFILGQLCEMMVWPLQWRPCFVLHLVCYHPWKWGSIIDSFVKRIVMAICPPWSPLLCRRNESSDSLAEFTLWGGLAQPVDAEGEHHKHWEQLNHPTEGLEQSHDNLYSVANWQLCWGWWPVVVKLSAVIIAN